MSFCSVWAFLPTGFFIVSFNFFNDNYVIGSFRFEVKENFVEQVFFTKRNKVVLSFEFSVIYFSLLLTCDIWKLCIIFAFTESQSKNEVFYLFTIVFWNIFVNDDHCPRSTNKQHPVKYEQNLGRFQRFMERFHWTICK